MTEEFYEYATDTDVCVVLTTCSGEAVAATLARALVEEGLAACVTRILGACSVYRWRGKLEEEAQVQLIVKTTRARIAAVREALGKLHPDEEPEFLVLNAGGSRGFVSWIVEETGAAVA